MSNLTAIAIIEAKATVEGLAEAILDERLLAAMRHTRRSWCCRDENEQFIAACEAVASSGTEDEKERIVREIKSINKASVLVSALQVGIPVDIEGMAEGHEQLENPIGLVRLWDESGRPA